MGASASRNTVAVLKASAPKHAPPASQLDAQLSQNLKKVGQVNVDSPETLQRSLEMTHIVRTRALSESPDAPPSSSNIDAFGLSELFDGRKQGGATLATTMQRHRLDADILERLASRYNTPSIGKENTLSLPDGDQRTYREAVWIDRA